jgi:ribosomal protein L11 methyltransferase
VEGVKPAGDDDAALTAALALATALTGVEAALERTPVPADGWLARTRAAFPQQLIGRRFAVRGTHLSGPARAGRIMLTLDAGLAFGSGEHGSTRGCLRALERVAYRRPPRILDMGTGSGILAMAAARLLHRRVRAVDIEPWSIRVARQNAALNRIGPMLRCWRADGWHDRAVRAGGPYDLVLANILARPLCLMARPLAAHLAPGGTAILAGLLAAGTGRASPTRDAVGGDDRRRALDDAGAARGRASGRAARRHLVEAFAQRLIEDGDRAVDLVGRHRQRRRDAPD